jgi:hypothetical protein
MLGHKGILEEIKKEEEIEKRCDRCVSKQDISQREWAGDLNRLQNTTLSRNIKNCQ